MAEVARIASKAEGDEFQANLRRKLDSEEGDQGKDRPPSQGSSGDQGQSNPEELLQRREREHRSLAAEGDERDRGAIDHHRDLSRGWRGPGPILGLAPPTQPATLGEALMELQQRHEERGQQTPPTAEVDPQILAGLRQAGLERPLTGLDDERLLGSQPLLEASLGWQILPIPGGLAYLWEACDGVAHQRWEGGNHHLLESAHDTLVQRLERKGRQVLARTSRRTAPNRSYFRFDHDPD